MAEPIPEKEIDGAYELPEGWVWCKLEEVFFEIINGTTEAQNVDRVGFPVTRIETIQKGEFDRFRVKFINSTSQDFLDKYKYRVGDIALSHINSKEHVRKTAIYLGHPETLIHGMNLLRLRLDHTNGFPQFFYLYFQSEKFRNDVRDRVKHAVNQVSINQKNLSQIILPLPPLAEQRRITAKLEALLAQVNAAKEHLAAVPPLIKRFRQSVLAAACSGRLTEDWRREHPDVEPARKLIEEILQRRLSQANTPTKKQKIKDIHSHREERDSDLLPRSWEYVTLDKLCESFQYGSSKKSMPEGKIPVLRMGNIQNGEIDWNNLVYTSDEWELEKYSLEPGTALFNRTNSPELVGKTAIYRGERPAIFAGYLIKINNYKELNSEYLNYCLNTTYTKEQCLKVRTDGVSQSNINAQKLGKFKIPFCPLEEQEEIVRHIDALFKVINSIEYHYKKATSHADRLTQSILAKAFRGELVSQDPDDEPASVLLKRIRKERTGLKKKSKPRKRRSETLPDPD